MLPPSLPNLSLILFHHIQMQIKQPWRHNTFLINSAVNFKMLLPIRFILKYTSLSTFLFLIFFRILPPILFISYLSQSYPANPVLYLLKFYKTQIQFIYLYHLLPQSLEALFQPKYRHISSLQR